MHSIIKHELIVRAIITQNDSLLVNQGTHHQSQHHYYALPGGHVETDETCKSALQRELLEELAIDCEVHDLCFVIEHVYQGRHENDNKRHELILYFETKMLSVIQQTNEKIDSPEPSKNFRWLPISAIAEAAMLPEISRHYLKKYFSQQQASHYAFQDSTSTDEN